MSISTCPTIPIMAATSVGSSAERLGREAGRISWTLAIDCSRSREGGSAQHEFHRVETGPTAWRARERISAFSTANGDLVNESAHEPPSPRRMRARPGRSNLFDQSWDAVAVSIKRKPTLRCPAFCAQLRLR